MANGKDQMGKEENVKRGRTKSKHDFHPPVINLDEDPENQDWLHRPGKKQPEQKKEGKSQKSGNDGASPAERK